MDKDDRGYEGDKFGWMVCIAGFFLNLFRTIPSYCFGVFIAEFKRIYDLPMVELDWVGVLSIVLTDFLTPIPTAIIRRFGLKGYTICSLSGTLILTFSCLISSVINDISWLFLTFSIFNGLGSSLIFITSTLVVREFFSPEHKYHLLATSLFHLAYPITILVFPPFYAWVIKVSSWRVGFLVQGAKMFVAGIISSLVFYQIVSAKNRKDKIDESIKSSVTNYGTLENSESIQKLERNSWLDIWKRPERICWLFGVLLTLASQLVPLLNLPHYMENRGYQKIESSLVMVVIGLTEVLIYIVIMPFSNKFKGNLLYLNVFSSFSLAIIMFIWPVADPTYGIIMVFSIVLGVSGSVCFVFVYATSSEVMDMDVDMAWTSTCFVMGFGSLANPLISGLVYDLRNSYDDVFHVVGGVGTLNGLNFCAILLIQSWKRRRGSK